jgi:hypothetical protein
MNILSIPFITGGLSHLLPLYVLQQKYLRGNSEIKNHFLVNENAQNFLNIKGAQCVPINYSFDENLVKSGDLLVLNERMIEMEKMAYNIVKPSLIIEDSAFFTPLIAEKNHLPRISIQRTGVFRSIDKRYRIANHVHSLQKGGNISAFESPSNSYKSKLSISNDSDMHFLRQYTKPKVKIIPGIASIERLPVNIEDRESYFYTGPLLIIDKPSKNLSNRLNEFLNNKQKPIVFITTGTIDKTPIENFIEFFVKRNYTVITTCNCEINELYKQDVFYNKLLPLHYICGISNLVIHQCGSGMYHYPLMNKVPFLTIGTQCYDREDIALRLEELGISGHIPHPDDNPNYWNIFLELINKFENNTLTDFVVMDKLLDEINETMSIFNMDKVIQFALS